MFRYLVRKAVQIIKGRSAKQINKSPLDSFIDEFESQREIEPASRRKEREKAEAIAAKRSFEN